MNKYYTSASCPKCGRQLKTSDVEGYSFVCEECDENFYTMEVKGNKSDLFEINIPMTSAAFRTLEPKLLELTKNYKCDFLGHDDYCNLTDIGWEKGFPDSSVLNQFITDLEAIMKLIENPRVQK